MIRAYITLLITVGTIASDHGNTCREDMERQPEDSSSRNVTDYYCVTDAMTSFNSSVCRQWRLEIAIFNKTNKFNASEINDLIFPEICPSGIAEAWIQFDPNLKFDKKGEILGNQMNFTLEKSSEVCIALQITKAGDGRRIGTWTTVNCATEKKTLCYIGKYGTGVFLNETTNIDVFSVNLFPSHGVCDFVHNGTEDTSVFEKRLSDYASSRNGDCSLRSPDLLHVVVTAATTCDDDKLVFDIFNTTCANFTSDVKYAIAVVPMKDTKIREYIPQSIITYDENRRRTKLASANGAVLSYSVLTVHNGSKKSSQITFRTKLFSTQTLLSNARNLTFDNGEYGLLASTHHVSEYRPECVFINEAGVFDTFGCTCNEVDGDIASCVSNHTTVFAVLLSVKSTTVPSYIKVLSIVLQSISLVFLAVTLFILIRVREKVRGERIAIQINLVVSLFCFNFIVLWGDLALHHPALCRMVAVLTQFFALSTALWMTNEAILLFLKTSRWAFVTAKRRTLVIATMVIAWGTAFVLCAITAIVGFSNGTYMDESILYEVQQTSGSNSTDVLQYDYCWLNAKSGIRWAAIAPITVLLLVNLGVSVKVAIFVYRKRKENKNFKPTEQSDNKRKLDVPCLNHLSASVKAFALMMPTLGTPWLLLFASNATEEATRIAFMYVNVIVNGLQGVLVFILYCIVGKEVRAAAAKSLSSFGNTWYSNTDTLAKRRKKGSEPTVGVAAPSGGLDL